MEALTSRVKSLEEEIEVLKKKEIALLEKIDQRELFFASLIHEIRTPISAILGLSEILSDTELSLTQKGYLEDITSSGNLLSGLVNDLLDLSKLERGYLEIDKQEFELFRMLENVKNVFKLKLKNKKLDFNVKIEKGVPAIIYSDSLRISQVLINLINNAIKFTDNGEISLHIRQTFKVENEGKKEFLEFCVCDSGIGLKASELENIFKSFVQADKTISRKYGGTGLGLAICKQLVELMGGKIDVRSIYGQGSEFIFSVETGMVKKLEVQQPFFSHNKEFMKHALRKKLQGLKEKHILLVEDNSINQLITESFLEKTNIKVVVAKSGEDALLIMKKIGERIDLILMDIKLPNMNGYEATKFLRENERYNNIPIISFSANRKEYAQNRWKSVGMDNILTKPINIVAFYQILLKYLDR